MFPSGAEFAVWDDKDKISFWAKVGRFVCNPFKRLRFPKLWISYLGLLLCHPFGIWGLKKTNTNMNFVLTAAITVKKSFVTDPGVLYLLSASMQLGQANLA